MFLLWLRQLPQWRNRIPASVPQLVEGRSSPTNTPVFPRSPFILPSFAWFYIFFPPGQVLLSAISWCSACTSVSEGVLLMYRGEKHTPHPPTPPPSCSLQMCSSLYLSNILLCICTNLLYPFICQWTSKLLPCPSYWTKLQSAAKNIGVRAFFSIQWWFPHNWYMPITGICPVVGLLGCMMVLFLVF